MRSWTWGLSLTVVCLFSSWLMFYFKFLVNFQIRSNRFYRHFLVRLGLRSDIKKKGDPREAWGFVIVYLTLSNLNLTKKCRSKVPDLFWTFTQKSWSSLHPSEYELSDQMKFFHCILLLFNSNWTRVLLLQAKLIYWFCAKQQGTGRIQQVIQTASLGRLYEKQQTITQQQKHKERQTNK